jgi:hypothetical protein
MEKDKADILFILEKIQKRRISAFLLIKQNLRNIIKNLHLVIMNVMIVEACWNAG